MDEFSPKEEYTPLDAYNPEDEYEAIGAPSAIAAESESDKAAESDKPATTEEVIEHPEPEAAFSQTVNEAPAARPQYTQPQYTQPPQGYAYPYPPQPPYPQQYARPVQPQQTPAQPRPYYPGAIPEPQPYYPNQNTAAPQYPQQPAAAWRPQQPQQPPHPRAQMYQQPGVQPQRPIPPYPVNGQPISPTNTYPAYPAQQGYQQPYPPQYPQPQQPSEPKPRTSTGTKVFLIVLTTLMIAMVIGFTIYIISISNKDKATLNNGSRDIINDIIDNNDDNNGDNGLIKNNSEEEFDLEITLVEDNGDTQKRDDDNPDSVGKPDKDAKPIELEALPKDSSDPKYTTQSAYESVCDSVVTVELYDGEITGKTKDIKGTGTGTIITSDGYIVTNAHVIANSRRYAVRIIMNSGDEYQAKVVGYDSWTDLAILKIDSKGLSAVTFGDSDLIEIGQDVIAIGSPGGERFQNSLTKGIVSAVDRELTINKYVRYIQSDAAISLGNSGGPLCNIYGQVIGINTAKSTASGYEAMTFSIPSTTVKEIVSELMRYGYVRSRARIGFSGSEVSVEGQYYYGLPSGLMVEKIDETGALAGTKIQKGDIITAIDGEDVSTFQDVYAVLNEHKAGDKVTISIYRPEEILDYYNN